METTAWQATEWFRILNFFLLLPFVCLIGLSLFSLWKRKLSKLLKAIWTVVIVFIPVLGSIAFYISGNGKEDK